MIKHTRTRRAIAGTLIVIGALLMWFAPDEAVLGAILLVLGAVLEAVGITIEHRSPSE